MWGLDGADLPDEPGIERMERTGLRPGEIPFDPEEAPVKCPVCGAECETIYKTLGGETVGCDVCVYPVDAYGWKTEGGME